MISEKEAWRKVKDQLIHGDKLYICYILRRRLPDVPDEIKAAMWSRMIANKPSKVATTAEEWWTRDEEGLYERLRFCDLMIGLCREDVPPVSYSLEVTQ